MALVDRGECVVVGNDVSIEKPTQQQGGSAARKSKRAAVARFSTVP